MKLANYIPSDPEDGIWDVVVIGTGAGGGTAGFNLARHGRSVLFLERGRLFDDADYLVEEPSLIEAPGKVDASCLPYDSTLDRDQGGAPAIYVGAGIGGSTAFFSMVMDRFRPVDLQPGSVWHVPPGTSLPTSWPIQYEDLEPYYQDAEALFRVRGTDDPLNQTRGTLLAPLAPSHAETAIYDTLVQSGVHPYRLHYAREHVTGCDGCVGKLCPHNCRNDAGRVCVMPALKHYGARILPDCLAVKLEGSGRVIGRAICLWNG